MSCRGSEKHGRASQLLGLGPPLGREPRHHLGVERLLLAPATADLGVDPARCDRVHADAILGISECERLGQPDDSGLRGRIGRDHRSTEIGIHRADIDQAALRLGELRPEGGREPHVADKVNVDDVLEHLGLVLFVADQPPGAVDQDVQRIDLLCERRDGGVVAHVEWLEAETFVGRGWSDITNRDRRAAVPEGAGKGGSDPAGATADQDMLAGYGEIRRAHCIASMRDDACPAALAMRFLSGRPFGGSHMTFS